MRVVIQRVKECELFSEGKKFSEIKKLRSFSNGWIQKSVGVCLFKTLTQNFESSS